MAQHDYDIANDTAANVRADINNVLDAIVSNNSGASEPTTTFANMWWYDSTNDILKIRNETDTAWINVLSINQSTSEITPYNSGAAYGVLDEDDFASDSDTDLPTQQSTKAYVDGIAIGVGQTWQDVSGSRSPGTSYENTTGRPIFVSISCATNGGNKMQVSSDNATWIDVGRFASNAIVTNSFVVPDGWYYRVDSGNSVAVREWAELR